MDVKLKIAICEDTKSDQDLLLDILSKSDIPNETFLFNKGEDLLESYHSGLYDLIFMDIFIGSMTGIETIVELRKIDANVDVAFTTTSLDYTLDSYRLDAIKYIEKPVNSNAVLQLLKFVQIKKSFVPKIQIKTKIGNEFIPISDIVYIEHKGNMSYFICIGGISITSNTKLKDILPQLNDTFFYQCHKSYIVNFSYVRSLNHELNVFEMIEGGNVHIRRDSFWKIKRAYEDFLFNSAKVGLNYE